MTAICSAQQLPHIWYYLDYIDPRHLQIIYDIVMNNLWRGAPPKTEVDDFAIELDEVDEFGTFKPSSEPFKMPANNPAQYRSNGTTYQIHMPPKLLSSLEDDTLRMVLGYTPKTQVSLRDLQQLCLKDSDFLKSTVFSARQKCSALHQFIHDTYMHGDQEEPLSIKYEPELINVKEEKGVLWMDCNYKGTIQPKDGKPIPFEVYCSYNLLNPAVAIRSIFIDPRREVI